MGEASAGKKAEGHEMVPHGVRGGWTGKETVLVVRRLFSTDGSISHSSSRP